MSRRSRALTFPLLKRREPSRDRSLLGSKQAEFMAVSLSRRSKIGEKSQTIVLNVSKTLVAKKAIDSRMLFIPRLIRR